VVNVFPQR